MKKGNRGFTLIELLATIILLGLLFIYTIPTVVQMVGLNRNKMYVSDAKKLMAQAEYKIRSASSTLEKPAPNHCIIISLVYLDDSAFDTAPNRGKYVKNASYVVVKNTDNGKLEYSVAIVEQLPKGGYKGIQLVKGDKLSESNPQKYVEGIDDKDLIRVEGIGHINTTYINKRLTKEGEADYIEEIDHIYNKPDLQDSASKGGLEPPVITKAVMTSTSGKEYNSLDATLSLTAEDKDTPKTKLKVCISTTAYEQCTDEDYGNKTSFMKKFNFDEQGYNYRDGAKVNLYIIVKDGDGNEDRTTVEYEIHKNEPPVIDMEKSGFYKLPKDKVNRVVGQLRLKTTDDIDDTAALQICFSNNIESDNCTEYQKYSQAFNEAGEKEYRFNDDACALNGETKRVKVFIKDSYGLITSQVFDYTIHNDMKPVFNNSNPVTVDSIVEPFSTTGSLHVRVKVKGSDDVSYNDDMKVIISESNSETKTYDYDPNAEMDFVLGGKYDGATRKIKVQLKDECGHLSDTYEYSYKVYANQPPGVEALEVKSYGSPCLEGYTCSGTGGNDEAEVTFKLTDDIYYNEIDTKTFACISQDPNGCSQDSDYQAYSEYAAGSIYKFTTSSGNIFDGSTKDLYVFAKDADGAKTRVKLNGGYKLYKNVAPTIKNFDIQSNDEYFTSSGSLNVFVFMDAEDDLTELKDLNYSVKSNNTEICHGNFSNYNEIEGIKCKVTGNYDGGNRNVSLEIKDSYNATATTSKNYAVYANKAPEIYVIKEVTSVNEEGEETSTTSTRTGVDITAQNTGCGRNYKCPYLGDDGGAADVNLVFNISDDIDSLPSQDDNDVYGETPIKICVSENATYCNDPNHFQSYATFLNDGSKFTFNAGLQDPYDGQNHTLYVAAMDSFQSVGRVSEIYRLYSNQKPYFIYTKTDENTQETTTYPKISTTETRTFSKETESSESTSGEIPLNNIKKAKYEIEVDDDFDDPVNLELKVCYKLNGTGQEYCKNGWQPYGEDYDVDIDISKYTGQTYSIYSYVRDSLGNTSAASTPINYTLYNDETPEVKSVLATFDHGTLIEDEPLEEPEEEEYKCKAANGKFYDHNGNEVTEDEYTLDCLTEDGKFICLKYQGKFYGSEGEEVTEEEFNEQCDTVGTEEPEEVVYHCEIHDGKYYDKNGNQITQAQYNDQCISRTAGSWVNTSYDKVKISAIVQDPYDTYKICVNKTGQPCADSEYIGKTATEGFDGTSLDSGFIYYIEPQGIRYNHDENGDTAESTYYVFIKDSNGKVATIQTKLGEGETATESCVQNSQCAKINASKYVECENLELNNYKSEFVLDTSQSSQGISAARCSGRCYLAEDKDINETDDESARLYDTSGIFSYYKKKLFFKDRFNSNKACTNASNISYEQYPDGDNKVDYKKRDCSFVECFKNPNKPAATQYETKAIGMKKNIKPRTETVTYTDSSGNFYESQEYYIVYIGSYDGKSDDITLNPTNNVVIPAAYNANNSIFRFNSSSNDFYVRVRD